MVCCKQSLTGQVNDCISNAPTKKANPFEISLFASRRIRCEWFDVSSYQRTKWRSGKPYTSHAESKQIANALNKLYPKLNLYCRFALMAMQLEGLIMRKVLLRGTEAGILALPIHDAIAVEFDNQDWAKDVMEEVWQSVMSKFHKPSKTSVKFSFQS